MCGIAGFAPRPGRPFMDAAALGRMISRLAHRGPDAETMLLDQGFGLGHRRLAIIDVAGGDNPLEDPDRQVALVFNGEIYNHRALRRELEAAGARPRTGSDGEVIVHGYLVWGLETLLRRLRGMYAFALFDRRDRTLHLARDPFGIKPLFYSQTDDALLFGSEIKAMVGALPGPWAISSRGLLQSACLGFTLSPDTIYERIASLPAGHALSWRAGRIAVWRHYELRFEPGAVAADPESLWDELKTAVRSHLMSEVPLGVFLSGGLDSSAVAAAVAEGGGPPVDAVTVGIMERGMGERPFARDVASALGGIRLHEETAAPAIAELLPRLAWHLDGPFADSSAAPTWLVCEAARRHVTVALSGDGGDENFAGYRRTRYDMLEDRIRRMVPASLSRHVLGPLGRAWPRSSRLPQPLRAGTLLQNISGDWLDAYIHSMARVAEPMARRLLRPEVTDQAPLREGFIGHTREVQGLDPLSRILAMDFRTWLTDDILVKVDRMSMAHALEVRVPLLDTDFVAHAAKLPGTAKLANGVGKRLFREALKPRLPASVLDRAKQGFHLPIGAWLKGPLGTRLDDIAGDRTLRAYDYLDPEVVARCTKEHRSGSRDRTTELWFVLVMDAFLQHGPETVRAC